MYSGFCLRIRFDWLLELLHVVGEGDQVVVRRGLDLRELGLVSSSFPHAAEDEEDDASCDEQGDQGASARARAAVTAASATTRPAGALRRHAVDEVQQRRRHALAAVGVECLGGKAARNSFRQDVASRAKVPSDHGRVRSLASERVVERLEDAVGTAAGLLLRGGGQDRDVDGTGSRSVDLLAQLGSGRPRRSRAPRRDRRRPGSTATRRLPCRRSRRPAQQARGRAPRTRPRAGAAASRNGPRWSCARLRAP